MKTESYIDTISGEELLVKESTNYKYYLKQTPIGPVKHRVDGPAVINNSTSARTWCRNGELHRLDGPAYISGDETILAWYVNGVYINKSDLFYTLDNLKNGRI